jgi:hypothetical protein
MGASKPSLPGLTRQSMSPVHGFGLSGDARVEPGHDDNCPQLQRDAFA